MVISEAYNYDGAVISKAAAIKWVHCGMVTGAAGTRPSPRQKDLNIRHSYSNVNMCRTERAENLSGATLCTTLGATPPDSRTPQTQTPAQQSLAEQGFEKAGGDPRYGE